MSQTLARGGDDKIDEINAIVQGHRNEKVGIKVFVMDEKAIMIASNKKFIKDVVQSQHMKGNKLIVYRERLKLPGGQEMPGCIEQYPGKKRPQITAKLKEELNAMRIS